MRVSKNSTPFLHSGDSPGFGLLTEGLNRSAHYFPGSCDRIALILT